MPFFMHKTWTAPELNVVRSVIYLNVTKKIKLAKISLLNRIARL